MPKLNAITQSQYLVTASVFPGTFFTKFRGFEDKSDVSEYADGEIGRRYKLKGTTMLEEMSLAIPFDPIKHAEIINFYRQNQCTRFTMSITPVSCGSNPVRLGPSLILTDVQLTAMKGFEVDRSSSEVSELELSIIADDYSYN